MNRFLTPLHTCVILMVMCAVGTATHAQTERRAALSIPCSKENMVPTVQQSVANVAHTSESEEYRQAGESPILRNRLPKIVDAVQAALPGKEVGFTYYDFQTNASMPNRLVYSTDGPDKYIQMLWMVSKDSTRDEATRIPGFAGNARGTHYTFLEVGNNPDDPGLGIEEWQMIEAQRSGWPCIVKYADGVIGTPSHPPVHFYGNSGVGDPPILYKEVTAPADSAFWPRATADSQGNTHLIYNRAGVGAGSQVAYRRSVDAGFTWGSETLFTGATAPEPNQPSGFGGDTYAVTARKNKVVIAYTDNSLRLITRTSTDGGATWPSDMARVIFSPTYTEIDSAFNDNGTFEIFSDTVPTPNGHIDVIIDGDGLTHVVVGAIMSYLVRKDTNGARPGTIFITNPRNTGRELGMLYFKEGETSLYGMAPPSGSSWNGVGYPMNLRGFDGLSRWPQLGVNAQNDVYCVYGSFNNGDTKRVFADTTGGNQQIEPDTLTEVDALNGHVWATYLNAGTLTWSPPTNITPDGINCQYGTLCDDVINNRLYIGYSASTNPGDAVTNVEAPAAMAKVMMVAYDATKLTPVNSVDDDRGLEATISIRPNPSRDVAIIRITSVTAGWITVSLVSTLGEIVMSSTSPNTQGEWDLSIATQSLPIGTYQCVVEQNGARSFLPLVVIR